MMMCQGSQLGALANAPAHKAHCGPLAKCRRRALSLRLKVEVTSRVVPVDSALIWLSVEKWH